MTTEQTQESAPAAHPFGSQRPPAGRPNRRLRAGRAMRWVYEVMAVFMALATALTVALHEWPGVAICGISAPVFWGLSRLFKRAQLLIYGSQLWERDALGRWHAPLDLDHLTRVAYIRDAKDPRPGTIALLLQASPPPETRPAPGAGPEEHAVWLERQEIRVALRDYSRRDLERLIAPWVAGRHGIAGDELAHLLELRASHPRTAGIRALLSGSRPTLPR